MSQWSVIVYSRTYEADYRFLAIPEDFTSEDEKWAISYIKSTTRKAEQLPGNPRWSLFTNHKHCVIGVTCMVKDLISSVDRTADKGDRPIYAFVGYVTKVDQQKLSLDIRDYSGNISLFQDAYNFVKDQWLVKAYELRIKPQTPRFPYHLTRRGRNRTHSTINRNFLLNMEDTEVWLWPNSPYSIKWEIWETACSYIDAYKSVSLCLGMPTEKDVSESPFFNATVASVNHPIIVKRVNPEAKNTGIQPNGGEEQYKKIINLNKQRIFGATIGIIICGIILFKWMVIAIIISGIIGWSIVFLLQRVRSYIINKNPQKNPKKLRI